MMIRTRQWALVATVVLAVTGAAALGDPYTVELMPILTGGSGGVAMSVNERGEVAVQPSVGASDSYYWRIGSDPVVLDRPSGDVLVGGINENGQIAGSFGGRNTWQATIWDNPTTYTIYGRLDGYTEAMLRAINDAKKGAGDSSSNGSNVLAPIVTEESPPRVVKICGSFFDSYSYAVAFGISNTGLTVGLYGSSVSDTKAWVSDGSAVDTLPTPSPGDVATAHGINDAGTRIVGAVNSQAALWELGPGGWAYTLLGTGAGSEAEARAIDASGDIVGWMEIGGDLHAFLYKDAMMYDLNDLVPLSAGVVLKVANDIADNGTIVGWAMDSGVMRAYAVVPEPATLALLTLGGLAALRRKHR